MITQKIIARTDSLKLDKIISRYGEDSMRQVVFIVVRQDPDSEELIPITIPEDAVGSFRILKPSGNFVIVPMSKSVLATGETAFDVVLPASANTSKGSGYYDIRITSDTDKYYFTAQGDFIIDDNIISDEVLEDVSEVNGLIFPDDFLTVEDHVAYIDDETVSTDSTWSSDKISEEIEAHAGGDVSKTVSGNPVTFTDGASAPLVNCLITISPKQAGSGDPSPDNIRPISGYSSVNVNVAPTEIDAPQTYTINLGGPYYSGQIDAVRGVFVATHKGVVYNGTETGWRRSGSYQGSYYINSNYEISDRKINTPFLCDRAEYVEPDDYVYGTCCATENSKAINFWLMGAESTLADWTTYLSNNPMQVVYELETPLEIPLTPTVISSLLGNNTMWTDGDSLEIEYITDDFQPIAELINRNATVYSTSEHPAGTWIDGKTVYERVYTGSWSIYAGSNSYLSGINITDDMHLISIQLSGEASGYKYVDSPFCMVEANVLMVRNAQFNFTAQNVIIKYYKS